MTAFAIASHYLDGPIQTARYLRPFTAPPVLNPASGPVAFGTKVSISCATPGALIYYSLNPVLGVPPPTNYYSGPLTVTNDVVIWASAEAAGYLPSRNALNGSPVERYSVVKGFPAVIVQPVSETVTAGQNASFSVGASGTAPLGYQWRFNGLNLAGKTGTNLTLNSMTLNSAGNYDVIVSNSVGSVTSAVVRLTAVVPVVPPVIVIEPVSQSVIVGQSASFSVVASGTQPLGYQWRFGGVNLAGE